MAVSKLSTRLGRALLPAECLGTHRVVVEGQGHSRDTTGPSSVSARPVVSEPACRGASFTWGRGRGASYTWGPPPLALVLGWAGATHKNLTKYSSMYQRQGCTTAQLTLPTRHVFRDTHELPEVMSSVVSQLESVGVRERPVIVHCLSDTGAMCYQGLALATRGHRLDIRGVVWDSSPGPRPEITAPCVAALLAINWFCARRDGFTLPGAWSSCYRLLVDRGWPNYLRRLQGKPVDLSLIEGVWAGHFGQEHYLHYPEIPELFLYSNSDFYLKHKYLETQVLARRRKAGANFQAVRFRGSAHVQHYRKHRAEYEGAVQAFLRTAWGLEGELEEQEEEEEQRIVVSKQLPSIGSFGV